MRSRRGSELFARAAQSQTGAVEGSQVCPLSVPARAIARTHGIAEQGRLERATHEGIAVVVSRRGVGQIRATGRRRIGVNVGIESSAAAEFLLKLGLDGVEGEVFPAVLCLERSESEAALEMTGNLFAHGVSHCFV